MRKQSWYARLLKDKQKQHFTVALSWEVKDMQGLFFFLFGLTLIGAIVVIGKMQHEKDLGKSK